EQRYVRVRARCDAMRGLGWLEAVRRLAEKLPDDAKPLDFIGYGELRGHLRGERTLAEAREAIAQATRRYAKRQLTWFRKEPGVHWLTGFGDSPEVRKEALAWLLGQGIAACAAGGPAEGV